MDIIETIKSNHGIEDDFYNGKIMDSEKRLFMSDNYVIKLYFPKKYNYYYNELEVYNALSNKEYLPTLYFNGEEENYKYVVLSKENGKSLFDSWDNLSNEERIQYLKDISTILKDINKIKTTEVDFKNFMNNEFNNSIGRIDYSDSSLKTIKNIYDDNICYIGNNETSSLIHIDTHFYNFMINKDGKLIAYDFENTINAPLDFQLVRLYRMNYYPESFIYPKDSLNKEQIKSYNIVIPTIINNYPEIIDFKNVENRLKIYLLNYLLKEIIRCNIKEEKAMKIIFQNDNIKLKG